MDGVTAGVLIFVGVIFLIFLVAFICGAFD